MPRGNPNMIITRPERLMSYRPGQKLRLTLFLVGAIVLSGSVFSLAAINEKAGLLREGESASIDNTPAAGLVAMENGQAAQTKKGTAGQQEAKKKKKPATPPPVQQKGKKGKAAPAAKPVPVPVAREPRFSIGGEVGVSLPGDQIYKDVYGKQVLVFDGTFGIRLTRLFEIVVQAGYSLDQGAATLFQEKTEFRLIPLSGSFRFVFLDRGMFRPYLGGGLSYYMFKETSEEMGDTSGSGLGFHAEGGAYIYFGRMAGLDINVRYTSLTATANEVESGLGGISAGLGLRFRF